MSPRSPALASNDSDEEPPRILVEGRNCWQILPADRVSFLVDAKDYYSCLKAAALRARHSILIMGWDVDSRTRLEFADEAQPGIPNELGPFLDFLASRCETLQIWVLNWDSPLIFAADREWAARARFDWFTNSRLHFALDDQHPFGASQHQKLVVIDDCLAFLGGIDLTDSRLDSPEHRPSDPRRRDADGQSYEPHHDVQVAVDGAAAAALAMVARDRWTYATGERLQPTAGGGDCWPEQLAVHLCGVAVAIARTYPAWKGRPEIREIEALFTDAIARAKKNVYIESQYFCSEGVARVILDRLAEEDGPEFVVVLPPQPTGWLEQTTMGNKQRRLLAGVRAAGRNDRFRVYTPVVGATGDVGVNVHSKVIIVDGRFVTIGSANLNNRSRGLDSECNVAVECGPQAAASQAAAAQAAASQAIVEVRNRLLGEHLDVSPGRLATEIEARGTLIGAIEELRGPGRSLRPLATETPDQLGSFAADVELFDPAAPLEPERIAHDLLADEGGQLALRWAFVCLGVIIVALLTLAALWRWGPPVDLTLGSLWPGGWQDEWTADGERTWLITAAVLGAYVLGGLLMVPVIVLIAATGLYYGPADAMLVAGLGLLISAIVGYGAGALLGRRPLRRLAGRRAVRIGRHMSRRGLLSMTITRLLPVAPFILINLIAGASHVRFRDYLLGTAVGLAPAVVSISLFTGQLKQVVRSPDALNVGVLLALLLLITAAAVYCWRKFVREKIQPVQGASKPTRADSTRRLLQYSPGRWNRPSP